jgi:acetylornithine deacetylase/succinyl-diaminopimelate desuccinylase-like protein
LGLRNGRIVPTRRHPIVIAEAAVTPQLPTLLVYGHYDVQPAEPLSDWRVPPFSPVVVGDNLFGRGACDDKGQLFIHVKAIETMLRTRRALPVNLLVVFEGEEEVGSAGLRELLSSRPERFQADAALVSDMAMPAKDQPALTYALRGALSMEIEVSGARRELHSGTFGGAIADPASVLCRIVSSMHDRSGAIAIPHVYDRVATVPAEELAYMRDVGPSDASVAKAAGAREVTGEPGFSAYERVTLRPSLTVNGLSGGYEGPGAKAIIPSRAAAKLSMRLVPNQVPVGIERLIRRHIVAEAPTGVDVRARTHFLADPVVIDRRNPLLQAASEALEFAFGKAPVFLRSGGTIPVVNLLQESLDTTPILMGFALPDSRAHAPNERLHLPNFFRGILASVRFMDLLGERQW